MFCIVQIGTRSSCKEIQVMTHTAAIQCGYKRHIRSSAASGCLRRVWAGPKAFSTWPQRKRRPGSLSQRGAIVHDAMYRHRVKFNDACQHDSLGTESFGPEGVH